MWSRLPTVVFLAAAILAPYMAHAGDAEDKAVAWRRRTALRDRADRYMRTWLAPVVQRDPKCSGEGVRRFVERDARGRAVGERSEQCKTCQGSGKIIRWATIDARLAFYTPAFRARPDLVAETKAQPERWLSGAEVEPRIERFRIEETALVGDRSGLVSYTENGNPQVKEARWVETPAGAGKEATWCIYREEVDGPWGVVSAPTTSAAAEPAAPAAVEGQALLDLTQRVAVAGVKHTVTGARIEDGVLVVSLFLPTAVDATSLAKAVTNDIVPATRAALRCESAPDSVRLEFLGRWRDRFGVVVKRPAETAWIARTSFDKIVFDNLSQSEALAIWTLGTKSYEGEVPWWKD